MFPLRNLCFIIFILAGFKGAAQNVDSLQEQQSVPFSKFYDSLNKKLIVKYQEKQMVFDRRGVFHFVPDLPDDLWQIAKSPFRKQNLEELGLVTLATVALLPFDQVLIDGVRKFSANIRLSDVNSYGVAVGVGPLKIIKFPRNLNSAFYQLGEGGSSMFLAGGLWVYGKLKKDLRAIQTAGDLAETFIIMGVTTQILKRISGRESPFVSTQDGGAWRPLPSFKKYMNNTPRYDAFPSGHLATMMATVTVLANNYPEKKWIKPVGYSIMGLTAWAMMNTEVHWISDYPLALALGYLSGKISTLRHVKQTVPKTVGF